MDLLYCAIQTANDLASHALTMDGYDAQWLKVMLKKKEVEQSICVPNTVTQRERLAMAHGHGGQFHASSGMHITNNNILIASEMKDRQAARASAKKDKKHWQQQQTNEEKALKILGEEGMSTKSLRVEDLNTLLVWHQVKDLPP